MFERFTEEARQVVVLAQDEARGLNHNYIGTEHLLLGLLREGDGVAARALGGLGVEAEPVRGQVVRIVGTGSRPAHGQIPFTPRAKKVLELGKRESTSLGHKYIGTEHLLLGLLAEGEGVAMRILGDAGLTAPAVRDQVIRVLSSPRSVVARSAPPATAQLMIACPHCGAPLETIATDRPNARFEVRAEGDRTCPGCGRRWTVAYSVSWVEKSD